MPKMEKMEALPTPEPLPTKQAAPQAPPVAPPPVITPVAAAPAPPPMPVQPGQAPPPQVVQSGQSAEDAAIVKRKKSKRKELQQASSGTSALRIPLQKSIGSTPTGGGGSSGLNIPR
jgi:hypothetical protein